MLGDILREARKNKKLTLAEVANQIGVTTGYLSNLEKNRQEPSLSVLRDLSEKLDIATSMLFMEDTAEDAIVLRKGERSNIKFQNLVSESEILTPMTWRSTDPTEIEALRLEIPPRKRICSEDLSTSSGECIYVLEGELEYRYGNDSKKIEKGGSIYIPRKTGHYIFNPGEAPATIIWITKSTIGGQGNG
ncbi:helix-turn-helix domain-containing protein [Sporosalibacterium faouarense]|uniref:helix-turn-helix domain-containing protein n=1 Tax=Sporosalibacterium faouarense TaxID=516123 RepID=UPI00141D0A20|nr:XRE family transcriptional regulator [Sporosalibacterium faouarense]MTI47163.1 helix-turn-helix domain-containing protein [Bacillota bacterium]